MPARWRTLPLNGRQLSQLYLLAPGAQTAGGGSFDNIRFSGRANQENAVRFDGIEASSIIDASPGNLNGEISTGFRLQNSLETVSEFRVDSSNYPAEFGTGTAGQISVVSKSGGNDFHGGVFEYLRNNALDARNFFDGAKQDASAIEPIRRLDRRGHQERQVVLLRRAGIFAAARRRELDCYGTERVGARAGRVLYPAAAGRLPQRNAHQQPRSGPGATRRFVFDRRIFRQLPPGPSHQRQVHANISATTATRAT